MFPHNGTTSRAEPGHSLLSSAVPGESDFLSHKSHLLASCVPRRRFMCLLRFSLFHRRYQEGEGEDRWRKGRIWQVTFQTRQCEAGL